LKNFIYCIYIKKKCNIDNNDRKATNYSIENEIDFNDKKIQDSIKNINNLICDVVLLGSPVNSNVYCYLFNILFIFIVLPLLLLLLLFIYFSFIFVISINVIIAVTFFINIILISISLLLFVLLYFFYLVLLEV
jgi:hypothetical protein